MADINLRDAEITGIAHGRDNQELLMSAELESGEKYQLAFQSVTWWELCSFGMENFLTAIDSYDANSLTEAVTDEQDIDDKYIKMVQTGSCRLFVLHASVGLSGWIVAGKMVTKAM